MMKARLNIGGRGYFTYFCPLCKIPLELVVDNKKSKNLKVYSLYHPNRATDSNNPFVWLGIWPEKKGCCENIGKKWKYPEHFIEIEEIFE